MQFDFLICSERSGSNLITKIIDSHPDMCGPFPTQMIKNIGYKLFRYGDLRNDDKWWTLLDDVAAYLGAKHSRWKTEVTPLELKCSVKGRTFGEIVRYVYEKEARAQDKKRIFLKDNHVWNSMGFIESTFDRPKYIFLVRDPRDMALTWKKAYTYGGVKIGAEVWQEDQSRSIEAYGYLKTLNRIILVRFEDLLTNTEEEMKRVCVFLGLDYVVEMLTFHSKESVKVNSEQISPWNDLQKPIITNNFNLYKTELSDVETQYVETLCSKEMDFFGYAREFESTETLEELCKQLPTKQPGIEGMLDFAV
jgi:hypothetical protein